ncbi:hypothetical protein ES705_18389 [subsurface metagenome]
MAYRDVKCPNCEQDFEFNLEELTAEDLAPLIKEAAGKEPAGKEDHRHKTADEFADCPECRSWFDSTATKYHLAEKKLAGPAEPAVLPGQYHLVEKKPAEPAEPAETPAPELPVRPAIGSIFKRA